MHADIVASPDQMAVMPVESDDIHFVQKPSAMTWLLVPKVDGVIDYVVRYAPYQVDAHGTKHPDSKIQYVTHSLNVYETMFSLPWFEHHAFAQGIFLAVLTLAGGLLTSKLTGSKP